MAFLHETNSVPRSRPAVNTRTPHVQTQHM